MAGVTAQVTIGGATARAPIVVVASAPGIFPIVSALGVDGDSSAGALAFNVTDDGTTPLNQFNQTAKPGQVKLGWDTLIPQARCPRTI